MGLLALAVGCSSTIGSAPSERQRVATPAVAEPSPSARASATVPGVLAPAEPTCGPLQVDLFDTTQTEDDPEPVAIQWGDRLAAFHEKVARLIRGNARHHIRIAVYGDSNLVADYQTGQMRRRLQERFGDAGHGLVSVGKPWWFYRHMDVQHGSLGWHCFNVSTDPAFDRRYGLTGIAAESAFGAGAAFVATAPASAPVGRTVDDFEVFYVARKGVSFGLELDGQALARVESTDDGDGGLGVHRVSTMDAPHKLKILPRGVVRVLGVALERSGAPPSFIVDSFGVGAMNSRAQATKDPKLETAMLRRRNYDLIIFHTGHNDGFTARETPAALRKIVEMHRAALPNAPILMMTPADRGKQDTLSFTRIAVEQRREIAADLETALWDLWLAMGGRQSMGRFKRRGLAMSDYIHFNEAGGAWAGDRLLAALWRDLQRYATAHPAVGCDPPGALQPD